MQGLSRRWPRFFGWQRRFGAFLVLAFMGIGGLASATDILADFQAFDAEAQALQVLSEQAAKKASAHPFAPPEGFALSGEFARRIDAFSTHAAALSARIDAMGGPKDLRCIYRGMAEDAKKRLTALHHAKNAGEQAAVLKDMDALFMDASEVTPKDKAAFADRHDGDGGQCQAAPDQVIKSLP
ncbi:MAG: hypothetical protein Q9M33_04410 [Robiginitomaculum sp.]|nr:hypothetical protein [Robiginitomaculum sp.]